MTGSKKRLGVESVIMKTTNNTRRREKRRSRMDYVLNDIDLQHQQDKLVKLQRLVPGASQLPSQLFLQTAKYIMHLRQQIQVLEALFLFITKS
ncbi:hypothetical protein RND71_029766 [Anisodus tanguticus]|uniref:Uncharacterized protein n=1 Tax=Anisodus tanguticus TaxID=243964 RepID=A0AAE1UZ13_9SOLA|nr:hypothetical protein RND71_029766 [Anisodus tanguticus]